MNKYRSYKQIVANYYCLQFELDRINKEKDFYYIFAWKNKEDLHGYNLFKEDEYKIFIGNDLDKINPEFLGKSIVEMFKKIEEYERNLK